MYIIYVELPYIHRLKVYIKSLTQQKTRSRLTECWSNVEPESTTLAQLYNNIRSMHSVFLEPSKHESLNQCLFNVGPPSTTLAQH